MLALVAQHRAEMGTTQLMVTHDMTDARAICDQVVLVADRGVTGPHQTETLLANPPDALRAYIGAP